MNQQTIETVKATIPFLEQHGEEVTKIFYQRLFESHPELRNVFNQTNQKKERQQRALAQMVLQAAKHIEQLEAVLPDAMTIAHKHQSIGIKPEQYPIVGENLLLAIKDVLGDQADDNILNAWKEAYGTIADVFISVEKQLADETVNNNGWRDYTPLVVSKKVKESSCITSFYLKRPDDAPLPNYQPGQYISVKVELPDLTHIRQYSMSTAPGKDHLRISVKREAGNTTPDGIVSNYLHNQINEGDTLLCSAPAGDFILNVDNERPVVLISGGVGLTPLMSILEHLNETEPDRPITWIHAAQNPEMHAFKETVEQMASNPNINVFTCYEQVGQTNDVTYAKEGYIDAHWLNSMIPNKKADFYFCGPEPLMKVIYQTLTSWEVPAEQIHYEFFGPKGVLEAVESLPTTN